MAKLSLLQILCIEIIMNGKRKRIWKASEWIFPSTIPEFAVDA
jgi:hypothetical protein